MGFDQKGNVVLRCSKGSNGRWNVTEKDFEKPLASFDSKEDAYEYATQLAKTNEGTTVEQEEDNTPPTTH